MPVYACYRGDCDNLAFDVEGRSPFVAEDALGCTWVCVESSQPGITTDFPPDSVLEMLGAQRRSHQRGDSSEGTRMMLLDCPDEPAFRRRLVLQTYPSSEESMARLFQAGWTNSSLSWGTGQPRRLTISNGRGTRTFQGETDNEVWYRAVLAVLGCQAQEKQAMNTTGEVLPIPLHQDADGTLRVGGSRVLLDLVIQEFNEGADPESIVHAYDTLQLADVYLVLGYYLRNREAVDAYLRAREEGAEKLRQEIESSQPNRDLRAKLLARRALMEQGHGAASGK